MGVKGRYVSLVYVAVLLATVVSAGAPQVARSETAPSASVPASVVSPFFIVARSRSLAPPTLVSLSVGAVARNERVTSACTECGSTRFVETRGSERVTLRATPPLRMRPTTRVIVGVTAGGSTGRWILFGFGHHRYAGLHRGCMPAGVTTLSPLAAAHPFRTIPPANCGPSSPRGAEYVLWTGTDHQLYEKQYTDTDTRWDDSRAIGSGRGVRSAPSVVIRASGERDVFFWGRKGELWTMSYTGFWSDAAPLPEAGRLGSAPAAVLDAAGVLHVFWRGTDRYLREMSEVGGIWSPGLVNSGKIGSSPAVVARPDDKLDVFWQGRNRKLYELHDPGSGQLARAVGGAGTLGSAPAAVLDANGVEDVFWRGVGGPLWELSGPDRLGPDGQGPISVPVESGSMGSAPSAVLHPESAVQDVFWRGTGGGLWEAVWYSERWHPHPVPDPVKVGSRPVAAVSPG